MSQTQKMVAIMFGLLHLGFPFYSKKIITRKIVTDVTGGHYVGITVVTT